MNIDEFWIFSLFHYIIQPVSLWTRMGTARQRKFCGYMICFMAWYCSKVLSLIFFPELLFTNMWLKHLRWPLAASILINCLELCLAHCPHDKSKLFLTSCLQSISGHNGDMIHFVQTKTVSLISLAYIYLFEVVGGGINIDRDGTGIL